MFLYISTNVGVALLSFGYPRRFRRRRFTDYGRISLGRRRSFGRSRCGPRCWNAVTPRSSCKCICHGNNHGGPRPPPPVWYPTPTPRPTVTTQVTEATKKKLRDEAINRILQKIEASAILTQQHHIAVMVEAVRQVYNHRDYVYDVVQELASSKPLDQKVSNVRNRSVQELTGELTGRLASGGVKAVSSLLRDTGFFNQPFGTKGPELDDNKSKLMQTFFEGTLNTLAQG